MGFMDKAKKMAEQAQARLDEAQKQFNTGSEGGQGSGPAIEYDQHGRPIAQEPAEPGVRPHGDPLAVPDAPVAAVDVPPVAAPTPGVPPTVAPAMPPAAPAGDPPAEDRNHPSYAPPKLSDGDPLAG